MSVNIKKWKSRLAMFSFLGNLLYFKVTKQLLFNINYACVIVLIHIITIVLNNIRRYYIHYIFWDEQSKIFYLIDQTALTKNKTADVKKYVENVITLRFDNRNLLYHGVIFTNVKLFIWHCVRNNAICLIIGGINQFSDVIIAFGEIRP